MLFTLEILIKKFKTNLEALQTHEKKKLGISASILNLEGPTNTS
jgi:hypothetical protein